MSFKGKITPEALSEVLKYLKDNPNMVKFEDGGGYPYFFDDPSQGDVNPVGGFDFGFPSSSNYPTNPNQGMYSPIELQQVPMTPLTGFDPINLQSGYEDNQFPRDRWDRRQDREQRREFGDNPQPGIDSRGRLLFEQPDNSLSRYERQSNRLMDREQRQFDRRYNTEDKIEQGYQSGDLSRDQADSLHEGNFSGIGGRRISPERAERRADRQDRRDNRSENRADNLNAAANLIGSVRGAVGDIFGAVRGGASLYAANKRNRYIEDWYRKQMQRDRTQFTPISQTQNANYLGGEGYGEFGGDMGGSLAMYLNGGGGDETKRLDKRERPGFTLRPNKYGDLNWFDRPDPEHEARISALAESAGVDPEDIYTQIVTNRNFRDSADIARRINKRIRNDEVVDGIDYGDYQRLKLNAFVLKDNPTKLSFEDGGLMEYRDGGTNPHFREGQYIEFEYGGKMYQGTVAKNENGKIYLK